MIQKNHKTYAAISYYINAKNLVKKRDAQLVSGKYEKEAHQLSADLLCNTYEPQCFLDRPLQDAANYMRALFDLPNSG